MIYEYALDPSLVVEWAVAGIGRCVGQFGMDYRRLVSDFPRDWKGRVSGVFYERFDYDDTSIEFQNAQPELEAYLQILTDCMVPRRTDIPLEADWLQGALAEHSQRPFYAILASNKPVDSPPEVITEAVIDQVRDERWYLPTIRTSRKSAAEIGEALRPVLQMASKIVLVDPYFDANEQRYRDSLVALVGQALRMPRSVAADPEIVIVTGVDQMHREREGEFTGEQIARVAANLRASAERQLPRCLPAGCRVQLVVLKNRLGADPMHNRFVLTDVGGVIVPYGLDDYTRAEAHTVRDDLQPMHRGIYDERWQQYAELRGVDVVLGPIAIAM
jgi:hypothetical protein